MVKLIHFSHSLKGMKKFTTMTDTRHYHIPSCKTNLGKRSLKYTGAVIWNNILKLGINPNISDFMFAKKLKHAIIESLLWITHNLHSAIKFTTNKPYIACCNLLCTLFQQMLQNSEIDMEPINLTGFTLPLLLFTHDVWSLHAWTCIFVLFVILYNAVCNIQKHIL